MQQLPSHQQVRYQLTKPTLLIWDGANHTKGAQAHRRTGARAFAVTGLLLGSELFPLGWGVSACGGNVAGMPSYLVSPFLEGYNVW